MKQLSISLFFVVSLMILIFQQTDVYTNISQAPASVTGAPGEGTCATTSGCHFGATEIDVTSTNQRIQLSEFNNGTTLDNGYTGNEGATVNLTVSFNQNLGQNYSVYGFSMTAFFEDGTPAGTFSSNQGNVNISNFSGKSYAGHKNATSTATWLVSYELPASISQDIIFYIAGNGGNNNGAADPGDDIYLAQYKLSATDFGLNEDPVNSIVNISDISNINVYPNPVESNLNLSFNLDKGGYAKAEIIDTKGSTVSTLLQENLNPGNFNRQFNIGSNLSEGIYLVRIQMNGSDYFQKILVQ